MTFPTYFFMHGLAQNPRSLLIEVGLQSLERQDNQLQLTLTVCFVVSCSQMIHQWLMDPSSPIMGYHTEKHVGTFLTLVMSFHCLLCTWFSCFKCMYSMNPRESSDIKH